MTLDPYSAHSRGSGNPESRAQAQEFLALHPRVRGDERVEA
jgi:hypothetical protein